MELIWLEYEVSYLLLQMMIPRKEGFRRQEKYPVLHRTVDCLSYVLIKMNRLT